MSLTIFKHLYTDQEVFGQRHDLLSSAEILAILQACSHGPQSYQIRDINLTNMLVQLLHLIPDDFLEPFPVESTIFVTRRFLGT
jgi:hypothetical protein